MNRLWKLVNDRLNYLTPTKKPVGWGQDKAGRRKRRLWNARPGSLSSRVNFGGWVSPR